MSAIFQFFKKANLSHLSTSTEVGNKQGRFSLKGCRTHLEMTGVKHKGRNRSPRAEQWFWGKLSNSKENDTHMLL